MRITRFFVLGAALSFAVALPRLAHAQASALTLTINAPNGLASWNSVVDPSSATATVTYTLYQKFGLGVNPTVGGASASTVLTAIGIGNPDRLSGSYCYQVAANSNEGPPNGIVFLGSSTVVCHAFLHTTPGGNGSGILRSDASGLQVGFGDQWNISYALDADALVTMQIYPPGTAFTTAANGLVTPTGSPTPTKTILGGVPRSGELLPATVSNKDFWDGTNESGVLQNNGLYFLYISVTDPLLNPMLQYGAVTTIPVNFRFTSFNTTGITPTVATADINYTITANASVRAVIAQPGRQFTIDTSSNVQSLNAAGTAIDTSTNSVIAVVQGQVTYGANTITWNGQNTLGVAVTTGVYAVGMSAQDGAGNPALNLGGNNGPLTGTIAVDRIPQQAASTGTTPSVTAITIGGTSLNLSGGSQVTSFGTINITLSAAGGNGTTVSLAGPLGPIAGGIVTVSGTAVTYSTGVAISTTGSYAVTINPVDPTGSYPGPQQVTNFTLIATPGPSVSSVTLSGNTLTLTGGTSVGNAAGFSPVFQINLTAAAGTNTTATLTGPSGPIPGGILSGFGSTTLTYSTATVAFSTAGAYTLVVHPIDATNTNVGPVQNVNFTITAAASGGGSGSGSNAAFVSSALAFPNPAKTSATIQFMVGLASTVTIDIYSLRGRRVFHQSQSYPASAVTQAFLWNLADDAGSTVADGVYLVHVTAANSAGVSTFKKKILVVK